jgi:hypothetical protein
MRTGALAALSIFAAATMSWSATAQTTRTPPPAPNTQTPAPATRVITPTASLINSVVVTPADSPLVRAAKRAVAARQNQNATTRVMISSTNLRRGRYAQSTGPVAAPIPLPPSAPANPPAPRTAPDPNAAAVQAKIDALKQEQEHLASEAGEPYGGDIEEDQVEARQKQTREQLEQLQKLQNAKPPAE